MVCGKIGKEGLVNPLRDIESPFVWILGPWLSLHCICNMRRILPIVHDIFDAILEMREIDNGLRGYRMSNLAVLLLYEQPMGKAVTDDTLSVGRGGRRYRRGGSGRLFPWMYASTSFFLFPNELGQLEKAAGGHG